MKPLHLIKREPVEFLAPLMSESRAESASFGEKLCAEAAETGRSLRDYLTYKLDVRASENVARFTYNNQMLSGFEAALAYLKLPVRDDLENGVMLQAAADVFGTFPGSRIMFPEVVDEIAKWKFKQTPFERLEPMIMQSRTISGNEIISFVVDDAASDYRKARAVTERGQVPIYSVQGTDQSVKIWKHGMGYSFTYEFARRASLDIMTPYVLRADREIERSKVFEATRILINGDGVNGVASEVNQSSYNGVTGVNSTNNRISYAHLLAWLVARAQAGYPVDTVVGNFDAYLQWLMMFSVPQTASGETQAETLARAGFQVRGIPILQGSVDFVLSSAAPANKLIGYSRADTLEELVESGSQITENQRLITTQEVQYVKTENSGFRIVWPNTRQLFNFGA